MVTWADLLSYKGVDDARNHQICNSNPGLAKGHRLVKVLRALHFGEDVVKRGSTSECQDDIGSSLYTGEKSGIVKHADVEI